MPRQPEYFNASIGTVPSLRCVRPSLPPLSRMKPCMAGAAASACGHWCAGERARAAAAVRRLCSLSGRGKHRRRVVMTRQTGRCGVCLACSALPTRDSAALCVPGALTPQPRCAGYMQPQQVGFMQAPHMPMPPKDSFGVQVPPPAAPRLHPPPAGHLPLLPRCWSHSAARPRPVKQARAACFPRANPCGLSTLSSRLVRSRGVVTCCFRV